MPEKKYYVQKGKSTISRRGIVVEGDEVDESDFKNGSKAILALCNAKIVGSDKPDLRTKVEIVKEREDKKKKNKNTKKNKNITNSIVGS